MIRIRHIQRIVTPHNHGQRSSLQSSFIYITSFWFSKVPEKWPEHTKFCFVLKKPSPREGERHNCPRTKYSRSGPYTCPRPWSGILSVITSPPATLAALLPAEILWSRLTPVGHWRHRQSCGLWTPSGARSSALARFELWSYNNTRIFHLHKTKSCFMKQLSHALTWSSQALPQ